MVLVALGPFSLSQLPYLVKDIRPGSDEWGALSSTPVRRALGLARATQGRARSASVANPPPPAHVQYIGRGVGFKGFFYFAATDGVHGRELWKSDGTPGSATMVKDMTPAGGGRYGDGGTSFVRAAVSNPLTLR